MDENGWEIGDDDDTSYAEGPRQSVAIPAFLGLNKPNLVNRE